MASVDQLIRDMKTNVVANYITAIFTLHDGYIYIRLDDIDPKALQGQVESMLRNTGKDVKTSITRGGLEIMVASKK